MWLILSQTTPSQELYQDILFCWHSGFSHNPLSLILNQEGGRWIQSMVVVITSMGWDRRMLHVYLCILANLCSCELLSPFSLSFAVLKFHLYPPGTVTDVSQAEKHWKIVVCRNTRVEKNKNTPWGGGLLSCLDKMVATQTVSVYL